MKNLIIILLCSSGFASFGQGLNYDVVFTAMEARNVDRQLKTMIKMAEALRELDTTNEFLVSGINILNEQLSSKDEEISAQQIKVFEYQQREISLTDSLGYYKTLNFGNIIRINDINTMVVEPMNEEIKGLKKKNKWLQFILGGLSGLWLGITIF